ncbi:MAG: FG-GAP-like repeat-containing protein [Nitrospirota bacterium]
MKLKRTLFLIPFLTILIISIGCSDGLDLPGNNTENNPETPKIADGDSLLIMGVKSDVPTNTLSDDGQDTGSGKGELLPQGGGSSASDNPSPWITRSFTVTVERIDLISAQIDDTGFPIYDSNGNIQMNPNLPPIEVFSGSSTVDLVDPTQLDGLLFVNNAIIPTQTIENQADKYNNLEITVSNPKLVLDCNSKSGKAFRSGDFQRLTISSGIFIVKSINNTAPPGGPIITRKADTGLLTPQAKFVDRRDMNFGFGADNLIASNKFLINITEPLIFPNGSSMVKLVIDPLGNPPGAGVDVHPNNYRNPDLACKKKSKNVIWVVMPFGSARFVNDYVSPGKVPGSPFLLEGTIQQIHDDLTDQTAVLSSQLPYPDPGPNNFWMQLQLNGSGGALGGGVQKVAGKIVGSKELGVRSQNLGIRSQKPEVTSHKSQITDFLYPQSAFTMAEPGDLDIIAFSDRNPASTYFYENIGVIGNASWAGRQAIDNGSAANAAGMFGSIALGDVDMDGDLDVIAGYKGGKVILYRNNNPGWSSGTQIASVGQDITGIEAGDFDNDGYADVVFASNDRRIRFYYNDGSGQFSVGPNFSLQNAAKSLTIGYINTDSFIDVVVGEMKGMVYWLNNDGNGGWQMMLVNDKDFGGNDITGIAVIDIDNNGLGDIAAGDMNKMVTILKNQGSSSPISFSVAKQIGGPDIVMGGVEQGDINNDGSPDVVAGFRGGKIYWYDNANGWSQNTVDTSIGSDVTDIETGDVDGDGDKDIIAGYSDQSIIYYANNGSGGFKQGGTSRPDSSTGGRVYLEIGDVDGDGGGIDTTPPAAVTDLRTGFIDGISVELIWTASGDDGQTGTADSYDIRYSTSPIDSSNFDIAIQAANPPIPQIAGTTESFVVSGLSEGVTYYFALKAIDDRGNISPISNVVFDTTSILPDNIPPSVILDLNVTNITTDSITLTWTASGDDGDIGVASQYDLRLSLFPINDNGTDFDSAEIITGLPAPAPAGTTETFTVSGLSPEITYYFAIKAIDNVGNVSPLSNIPQITTLPVPNDTVVTFGRPILVRVTDSTIITDYNNEPLQGSPGSYNQMSILAKQVDNTMIGTAIRVNGDLEIEPNPFPKGVFTIDPKNVGEGGIFTITPTHIRVIESPQSPNDPPPNDQSGDPRTFQVLSADNPTIIAAIARLTDGPTVSPQGERILLPQRRTNTPPPRPASISMIITDMRIVQGEIEPEGFPRFTGSSFDAVKNIDGIHPDIPLITSGQDRFELFNELQFNNIFASKTIPPDPCFETSSPDSCTRYNMIEVSYDTSSLRIVTTMGEVVDNGSSQSKKSPTTIEVRQQIQNSSATSGFNDFVYRDIGRFYIRITTPQIFPNSVNVLKIDPLGSAMIITMALSAQIDTRWFIFPVGIARFEVAPDGIVIPGGPFTMEGIVVQQHDINNSANLPLPNTPTLSDFWIQLTEEDRDGNSCNPVCDPIGTAGAPLLMRITDVGQSATVISDTSGNITPDIPGSTPTDEFRYLATKFDASVIGTRVKVKGEVALTPDPSGLALGTLVILPTQSIQVLDIAGP